jgi:hypothetical protein
VYAVEPAAAFEVTNTLNYPVCMMLSVELQVGLVDIPTQTITKTILKIMILLILISARG